MHAHLERLLMGSLFAGVEAEQRPDCVLYHFVLLKRSGHKIAIVKTGSGLLSLEEILEQIGKAIPVVLVLTGKGIVHRLVPADPDAPVHVLLSKVLPNAVLNEFYVGAVPSSGHSHMVSVIRASVAVRICEETAVLLSVIACRLGPVVVQDILALVDGERKEMWCGNHRIEFDADRISSITYSENVEEHREYKIGGESVSGETVIAFAGAFSGMMNSGDELKTGIARLAGAREEFLQRSLFRSGLKISLALVLMTLLANYFFFSQYWNRKNELESELLEQGNVIAELNQLNQRVESKTVFLNETGLLNRSSYAWCADQLAHSMPHGIQLTRMNFSPRIKIAKEDSIGFDSDRLEISGRCEESLVLNQWLQQLKSKKWILNVSIQSYTQNRAPATGEFKLDIELQ
ncbi:MAG TPA: PilN domain-containing protein [Bacteroidia bacterium]|nr:PilN domain-containing protein [Bacteroidia bacterium]